MKNGYQPKKDTIYSSPTHDSCIREAPPKRYVLEFGKANGNPTEKTDASSAWCGSVKDEEFGGTGFRLVMIYNGLKITTTRECAAQILTSPEKDMDAMLDKFVMTITAHPDYVVIEFADREKYNKRNEGEV